MKSKPKRTREENKTDGRIVGCHKSKGIQEDKGGSTELHNLIDKIGNLFNIYATDS